MEEEEEEEDIQWDKPQECCIITPEKQLIDQNYDTPSKYSQKTDHPRVIVHIDIDCFYAQVEMIRNPGLRNKPLGIQQKYIVVTCNYPAREYGVTKLMSIKDAKEKCPSLVLVSGEDLTHYRQMSYKISEYLQQYCAKVERLGFDENFLDITDLVNDRIANQNREHQEGVTGHVYGEEPSVLDSCSCGCHERLRVGSHIAADIREGLFKELGITCCGGIAHNKLLSKLVAGSHKPNQQTTLFPESTGTLMGSLKSVRNIPGIGHSSGKQLQELGVVSVTDLQDAELSPLKKIFGDTAANHMKQLALGIDEAPVVAFSLPQTLSDEDSFKKCCSVVDAQLKIKELLHSLLKRLLEDGRTPSTLRLTIRKMSATNKYLNRESRQCPIPTTVFRNFSQERILQTNGQLQILARGLFNKLINTKEPFHLTLINVAFAKLEEKSKNTITNFFSPKSAKHESCCESGVSTAEDTNFKVDLEPETVSSKIMSDKPRNQTDKTETANLGKSRMKNSLTNWLSFGEKGSSVHKSEEYPSKSDGQSTLEKGSKAIDIVQLVTTENKEICESGKDIKVPKDSTYDETSRHKQSDKRKNSASEYFLDTGVESDQVNKRARLTETFDDMIPEHIDKAVFYQLPPAIQLEILSSNKLKMTEAEKSSVNYKSNSLAHVMHDTSETNKNKISERKLIPDGSSTAGQSFVQKDQKEIHSSNKLFNAMNATEAPKTVYKGFFKSKAANKLSTKSGIRLDDQNYDSKMGKTHGNNVKETSKYDSNKPEDILERSSTSDKGIFSSSVTTNKSGTDVFIPPAIDRETFLGLPSDIQLELTAEWKKNMQTTSSQTLDKAPHFKMPGKSSSNTILSYFPKANR